MAYPPHPPPPSNLLHWPVCLWEKLAAPSSTIHYSPQASSVTLQCFRSPVASTPQQPKMLQYASVSHSPTSKHSVSGCCMPVSSQNLANPGSSLCLSPSHCACDCVCCDWPGLKGKPGGEGKCRTSACMCKIETLSLWVAVLMRVWGGSDLNPLHKVHRYRDLYQKGFRLYFERPWGSHSEDVSHNAWITCVYSWSTLKF